MSAKSKGRSRLAIRYFDDRILLTDTHAWAYYRVPSVSYEFTSPEEREALATNITVALAAIRMQDAEVQLRIAHRPYPAVEWAMGLDQTADGGPGWREYLEQIYQHVWAKDFWSKEIYLGVRLGQRGMRGQLSGGGLLPNFSNRDGAPGSLFRRHMRSRLGVAACTSLLSRAPLLVTSCAGVETKSEGRWRKHGPPRSMHSDLGEHRSGKLQPLHSALPGPNDAKLLTPVSDSSRLTSGPLK